MGELHSQNGRTKLVWVVNGSQNRKTKHTKFMNLSQKTYVKCPS
jgi:hypothetical protein